MRILPALIVIVAASSLIQGCALNRRRAVAAQAAAMAPAAETDEVPETADPEEPASQAEAEEPALPETSERSEYVVQPQDTLMKISYRLYGDLYRWREIKRLNPGHIPPSNELTPGSRLAVARSSWRAPASRGPLYRIVGGDTLGRISKKLYGSGLRWNELWRDNRRLIRDPDLIFAGFDLEYRADGALRAPASKAPAAAPKKPVPAGERKPPTAARLAAREAAQKNLASVESLKSLSKLGLFQDLKAEPAEFAAIEPLARDLGPLMPTLGSRTTLRRMTYRDGTRGYYWELKPESVPMIEKLAEDHFQGALAPLVRHSDERTYLLEAKLPGHDLQVINVRASQEGKAIAVYLRDATKAGKSAPAK